MLLSELLAGDPAVTGEADILGLTADSRAVQPGYLFAALRGGQADGADYVNDALARGAAAVLADVGRDIATGDIPLISADNPRRRLAQLAARFHGPQPRVIAAVTGTSGKTSVADFTRQIWRSSGQHSASLGTLGVVGEGLDTRLPHTTPDPVTLHAALAEIAAAGIDHLAIEASSHGLDQYRMDAVEVGAAGFTNLSQDHFDYHPTVDHYLQAKLRLFQVVMAPGGAAVLNVDVPEFACLKQACRARGHKVVTYGTRPSDLHLTAIDPGRTITVDVAGESHQVAFILPGTYQALNALCAAGLAMASGITPDQALAAFAGLKGVRGRVELVARHASGVPVYVDYAHKPGALEAVLATLRPLANGRLVVVFGCGGDRDTAKRLIMGRVAASYADRIFVTDDNPRSADPAAIRREVLKGCPEAMEIGDRTEAIAAAVAGLEVGDVLVIAGKGHESGQIIGDQVIPFDDAAVARAAITALGGESL